MRSNKFRLRVFTLTLILTFMAMQVSFASSIPDSDPKPPQLINNSTTQPSQGPEIHLAAGSFDPLAGVPQAPAALTYSPEEAAAAGTYIVQFTGPVLPEWKQALEALGVKLGDYLPDYAFLASMDTAAKDRASGYSFVRWIGPYQPSYKLAAGINASETRSYHILLAPWADTSIIQTSLASIDTQSRGQGLDFSAVLSGDQITQVARLPGVVWIEPYQLQQLYNDVAAGTIMSGSTAWGNGYTGSGVAIAVTDTGLDTGNPATIHKDFSGRVAHISSWPVVYADYGGGCETSNAGADDGAADVDSGHGTHVTGSVAGDGAHSSGQFKGLGYQATITFQAVEQYTTWTSYNPACPEGYYLTGIPDDVRNLLTEVYNWGARIQNNSWGGGDHGVYDTQASQFDDFVFNHPDMTIVVAAGNDGTDANADGYVDQNSVSSPGTAKNLIVVGASENERSTGGIATYTWGQAWPSDYPANPTASDYTSDSRQHMSAFSSRGPMNDGRIKPDVVAPGSNIISVRSSQASGTGWGVYNSYYMYDGGTSMASPLTAGAATVVRDYYMTTEGLSDPSAALIKATLINTAVDITGYGNTSQEAGQPIPNNHEGWGLVNVGAATTPGKRAFVDETTGINTGNTRTYSYYVAAGTPFKVSLVWSDYAANPAASKMLVNDLNLRVKAPDGTTIYLGNVFSGGWSQTGGSADSLNNVENVYIHNPTAGQWTVEVVGNNVPQGPQPFALFITGDISQKQPLTVTSISPVTGYNNATLAGVTIHGTGFEAAASPSLRQGATTIQGSNVVVDTTNGIITADYNLTGKTPGLYDVRVDNSTEFALLPDGFLVLDSTLPDLGITKTASASHITPPAFLTYTITINNTGLVSATNVIFTDTLPSSVAFGSLSPACHGGRVTLPDGFACTIQPSTLGPGANTIYTLVVSVPAGTNALLVNKVTVTSAENDAFPSNNTSQATTVSGNVGLYLPMVFKNYSLTPGAPTLNAISNPGNGSSYTLTWSVGSGPAPSSYEVEENGTIIASGVTGTSYDITGKAAGTYAYRVRGTNSYGAGAWSNQQSTTVAGGTNVLQNGDFENGRDGSWTEYSSNGYFIVYQNGEWGSVLPHNNSNWAAWLGGVNNELATLSQQVTIPSGSPSLTYWYWIGSTDTVCGNDVARVYIGSNLIDSFTLCTSSNTDGWHERTLNLSAYAGQALTLQFYVQTNSTDNSNFFLDDVAIQ